MSKVISFVRIPPAPASCIEELKRLLQNRDKTITDVCDFLEEDAGLARLPIDLPSVREVFLSELKKHCELDEAREEVHSLESDLIKGPRIHLISNALLRDLAVTTPSTHAMFNPIASYLLSQILPGTGVFGTCYIATIDYDNLTNGPYGDMSLTRVAELVRDAIVVDIFHRIDGIVPFDKEVLQRVDPSEVVAKDNLRYMPKYGIGFKVASLTLNESHATVDGFEPIRPEDIDRIRAAFSQA